jgi:hypothetical protein
VNVYIKIIQNRFAIYIYYYYFFVSYYFGFLSLSLSLSHSLTRHLSSRTRRSHAWPTRRNAVMHTIQREPYDVMGIILRAQAVARMRHRRRRRRVALVPAPFIHAIPFPLSRLFTRYLPVRANTPNLHIILYLNRRRGGGGERPSWYYLYTSIFTDTTARRDAHPKLVGEWCILYGVLQKSRIALIEIKPTSPYHTSYNDV